LFPFLFTPLLTSIPLPGSHERVASLRWSKLILISLALCLLREVERLSVAQAVSTYRRIKDERDGVYTGSKVVIRGAPLPQRRLPMRAPSSSSAPSAGLSWMYQSDEEEEPECIICAGNAGNTDLSQSVTSVSSHVSSASWTSMALSEAGASTGGGFFGPTLPSSSSNLGPLEAFCSVAPAKHVAHRGCILRWHAAYNESQRQRMPPIVVRPELDVPDAVNVVEACSLTDDTMTPERRAEEAKRKLRRAKTILRLAGFEYLLNNLRVMNQRVSNTLTPHSAAVNSLPSSVSVVTVGSSTPTTVSTRSPFHPSLTLAPFSPNQPSPHTGSSSGGSTIHSAVTPLASSVSMSLYASTTGSVTLPKDHLATLRTEWPPCPGCRSPIDLHFCAASSSRSPSRSSHSRRSSRISVSEGAPTLSISDFLPRRLLSIIATIRASIEKRNTTRLVTGGTIALSLSAQLSFLVTILSMMHARERAQAVLESLEAEMRARRTTRA
jgi:hypothetical protein